MTHRPYITGHALGRYQEFYPGAVVATVYDAMQLAEHIDQTVGRQLRGFNRRRTDDLTAYHLHAERTGMFLVESGAMVTFLRFGQRQYELAARLYPGGVPVTAAVNWTRREAPAVSESFTYTKAVAKRMGGPRKAAGVLREAGWLPTQANPYGEGGVCQVSDGNGGSVYHRPSQVFSHGLRWFGRFTVDGASHIGLLTMGPKP